MYITTFYSFKGGVGRTMALVNIAVDLAQRGKRVLVVDFDLEAPGLDTFDLPRGDGSRSGMVDFVHDYLHTGRVPDARGYFYESVGIGDKGGGLWIMPSGAPHEAYARKLAEIDWNDMYNRRDGYLLFEDLKLQWKASIDPDYVLIDSRTGHTEVAGICTRQLPDAVVILFFPNEQNLRGLTKVVRDIRAEETGPRNKAIKLHSVMSNVPDIDDEDQILAKMLQSFQERLELQHDPMVIHRYQSLSLLNQAIFTVSRPKSRLSREYRNLLEAIVRNNLRDRNSALQYIKSVREGFDGSRGENLHNEVVNCLNEVKKNNLHDGEVLYQVGKLMRDIGNFDESMTLFRQSIEAGYSGPEAHIARMNLLHWQFDDEISAAREALYVLDYPSLNRHQIHDAFTTLALSPEHSKKVLDCRSMRLLPAQYKIRIAKRLDGNLTQAQLSKDILLSILSANGVSDQDRLVTKNALVFPAMALGRYSTVVRIITALEPEADEMSAEHAFSLGMAKWAMTDSIVPELFRQSLKLCRPNAHARDDLTPNNAQFLAIAHWAIGQYEEASRFLDSIFRGWSEAWSKQFSYWRYLRVSASEFQKDIEELDTLIDGDQNVRPRFMSTMDDSGVDMSDNADYEEI